MTDHLLVQAAIGETEIALALLRSPAPPDPVTRRREMAQAAKALNRAARILTEWEPDMVA